MENIRPLRIVHIDDSDDDALLLARVLHKYEQPTSLRWVPSATAAMRFLEIASEAEIPDLIFCDLRMPGMSGHEFIRWLRQSKWKAVPVIVLSSSELLEDIRSAYALGANSFLIKPLDADEILKLIHDAVDYWSRCNLVPRPPDV
jgi:CheY-like chemotaxis protein